ncbi:MAG: glycosyltransferase family 4 protein [Bacteroidales bacterium]|nr:glycosyltransferase family 4 protein [Bacteroidales bacterium]
MQIGIHTPEINAQSFKILIKKVTGEVSKAGVNFIPFKTIDELPQNVDLYWDPNVGGGYLPVINKSHTNKPIVITFHGARLFSLSLKENKTGQIGYFQIIKERLIMKRLWKKYAAHYDHIITASEYSKSELLKYFPLKAERITPIYVATDTNLFYPLNRRIDFTDLSKEYFLHFSAYQPAKNVERIIKAYKLIAKIENIPQLYIVSSNYNKKSSVQDIKIFETRNRTKEEVAGLYQNAFAFIFPSLHEGFGVPIIEAMACGVPVLTSNSTSCIETAGNAALLVNPREVGQISQRMLSLVTDNNLRNDLIKKGKERVKFFSWDKCGKEHLDVFNKVLNG